MCIKKVMKNKENVKYGNIPVGETFEFEGKEYIVKEVGDFEMSLLLEQTITSACELCAFEWCVVCDQLFCCDSFQRCDNTNVYFVEK
jgi:hypothetical protein